MKNLFRKIAIIGTLWGMLFGLGGCAGDLLDTSPSDMDGDLNITGSTEHQMCGPALFLPVRL